MKTVRASAEPGFSPFGRGFVLERLQLGDAGTFQITLAGGAKNGFGREAMHRGERFFQRQLHEVNRRGLGFRSTLGFGIRFGHAGKLTYGQSFRQK